MCFCRSHGTPQQPFTGFFETHPLGDYLKQEIPSVFPVTSELHVLFQTYQTYQTYQVMFTSCQIQIVACMTIIFPYFSQLNQLHPRKRSHFSRGTCSQIVPQRSTQNHHVFSSQDGVNGLWTSKEMTVEAVIEEERCPTTSQPNFSG
jgi:hypothetical protein